MNNNCIRRHVINRPFDRIRRLERVERYLDEARIQDLDLYDIPLLRHRMKLINDSYGMPLMVRFHQLPHD